MQLFLKTAKDGIVRKSGQYSFLLPVLALAK
jgi:hypothetical protein